MVALSDRFKAWDVLAIGLNVLLLFCSCRLLLGYPCLCQGSPVHLTCTKPENTPTHLKKKYTHTEGIIRVAKPYLSGLLRSGYEKCFHGACASLTWILLVLERLHPLLLAQRPLRPGLSSLIPHHSPLDSHLKHPSHLDLNLHPQHLFC